MQLTDRDIQKYTELYFKEYGVLLDKKIAFEKGSRLVRLMKLTYLPELKINKYEKFISKI